MAQTKYTEQDYRAMIDDALYDTVDRTAGIDEWGALRSALMQWLADQDREQFAGHLQYVDEHGRD